MRHHRRRAVLRTALRASPVLLLAACVPSPPVPAPATQPTSSAAEKITPKPNALLPTYLPQPTRPTPDLPSKGPLFQDGYLSYPRNPQRNQPGEPPGQASTVNALVVGLFPPPTPADRNQAWQAVNKALNATVNFNIVGLADYPAKLGTIMAGNDLPDLIYFINGYNAAPNVPSFLERSMADLSPYLSGDAAKDYQNLAAIPTFAWKNSGALLNGHLYMLPVERYAPGNNILLKNSTLFDPVFGADYTPKDADDFKRVLQQLNQPSADRWAMAGYVGNPFVIQYFAQMFGAPNQWRLQPDGKLVKDIETPEYREAVTYVRDLVASDLYRPDSLTIASQTAYRDVFLAGRTALGVQGYGVNWADVWQRGLAQNPPARMQLVAPFAAHANTAPVHFLGNGFAGATAIKKATPDRIKELLRILNWLAAAFGSQEDLLLTYGVQDVEYRLDQTGNPIPLDSWREDVNNMPWALSHPTTASAVLCGESGPDPCAIRRRAGAGTGRCGGPNTGLLLADCQRQKRRAHQHDVRHVDAGARRPDKHE
jgi:putative aldouronate transport system substrate-binding protein